MILLDTNVVSEPLKLAGDVGVVTWIDAQIIETLYLSTISLAELRFGIAALAPGKRRDSLHTSLEPLRAWYPSTAAPGAHTWRGSGPLQSAGR